jgi:hypothetical protein
MPETCWNLSPLTGLHIADTEASGAHAMGKRGADAAQTSHTQA